MRHFIFLTNEGYAQSPNGQETENSQVLGYSSGGSLKEAFDIFINKSSYLLKQGYVDIFALELKNEVMKYIPMN